LDDDLKNAGLTRGDLKRAVYIAWNARPNENTIAEKQKKSLVWIMMREIHNIKLSQKNCRIQCHQELETKCLA
jgi:hypothetical protein